MLHKLGNYRLFLFANSVLAIAIGLFAPFFIVYLQKFAGGLVQFGFAIGLMVLAQAFASYFAGKHSDKFGRKIFLLASGFSLAAITLLYTVINSEIQLYALQILNGLATAVQSTVGAVFLADITKKATRGTNIGLFRLITITISALMMMAGGYAISLFGFKMMFYTVAGIIFISTLMLFYVKEK